MPIGTGKNLLMIVITSSFSGFELLLNIILNETSFLKIEVNITDGSKLLKEVKLVAKNFYGL